MSNTQSRNNYPKLHNAAWPGLVGKGPDSEPLVVLRYFGPEVNPDAPVLKYNGDVKR